MINSVTERSLMRMVISEDWTSFSDRNLPNVISLENCLYLTNKSSKTEYWRKYYESHKHKVPPIQVVRVGFMGNRYYIITDGAHRCAALVSLGVKTIQARISGNYSLPDISSFALWKGFLWRYRVRSSASIEHSWIACGSQLTPEEIEQYKEWGVRVIVDAFFPLPPMKGTIDAEAG